ncbi:MAG TPA: PilT/PilU family type 4a pilus ATPase [Terriglobales bacterium]
MAATGTARIQISLDPLSADAATDELLAAILRANSRVSDLIFSPGKNFQIQVNGEFVELEMRGVPPLTADDTRRIASDLIASNKSAVSMLREQGYCDVSYALPGVARFRVNIFIQRGSCAVVMRVIPTTVPDFASLGLPEQLRDISQLHDGLVLITGPRGSGKSSTLAALLDHINASENSHIITIEDPIEFLHNHKRSTVHQRELHSDTPSVLQALSAALRQAPNVIAVGELKTPETMELALEAAETGHLVLSTMNTINAQQAVERFASALPSGEQRPARDRLARRLRYVISQRLVPKKQDEHRMAVFEVWKSGSESLEHLLRNESHRRSDDPPRQNSENAAGWSIDSQIEDLVRGGIVSPDIAVTHAMDPRSLAKKLGISER